METTKSHGISPKPKSPGKRAPITNHSTGKFGTPLRKLAMLIYRRVVGPQLRMFWDVLGSRKMDASSKNEDLGIC